MHLILTDWTGAILFIVGFAEFALPARPYLRSHADALTDLGECDFGSDADNFADDFVADDEGQVSFTPASGDGVDVAYSKR